MTGIPGESSRAATVDIAKGIAIVIVVFAHVTLGLEAPGLISSRFLDLSMPFYLWYMCLFFFTAGLFVERTIHRKGVRTFITKKALDLGYPFLVWSVIFGLTQMIFSRFTTTGSLPVDVMLRGLLPWAPREHMWFLPGLFIALAVAALSYSVGGRQWRWLLLAVSVAMLALAPALMGWNQRLQYTFWTALGVLVANSTARTWFTSRARGIRDWAVAAVAGGAFTVVVLVAVEPGRAFIQEPLPLVFAASIGILAVFAVSRVAAAGGKLAEGLSRLGRWSLYIYLTHVPVLAALRIGLTRGLGVDSAIVITAGSVAACLALGCLAGNLHERGFLPWVFSVPAPIAARVIRFGARPPQQSHPAARTRSQHLD